MIRINLLPFRSARRKENIRKQISIYFLSVVLFAAVMGYFFLNLNNKLGILESDRAEKNKKLITYAATNKKIIKLKKKIKEIRTKVEVIEELERNKTGPVRLLDEIAMAVPKNKLWLRSLDEKKGVLTLMGSAMDNDTVALFMTNLKDSQYIVLVDLKSTKLRTVSEYKVNVTDFILTCKTYSCKKIPKEGTEKSERKTS